VGDESRRLAANQQTLIGSDGQFGETTAAVRELLVNGDFSSGLSGWIEFEQASRRYAGGSTGAIVDLAPDQTTLGNFVTVEFARTTADGEPVQIGIRQPIGKTLRVHTSLLLSFETRIITQQPPGGGEDLSEYPLVIQLHYIDIDGHEREWSHGYYAIADERHIPLVRATKIDHNKWQRIAFDLRSLSPLPKQITSLVVYASGERYQTRIANVSLTTSELVEPGR
jgi:hypothetical protein